MIGTNPESRIATSLIAFAENLLSRELQGNGVYKNYSDTQFFFRLNKDDDEGWNMAARCVNEIGEHFLRDRYKPDEMLPLTVAGVDEKYLKGKNGEFTADRALKARKSQNEFEESRDREEREPQWEKLKRIKKQRLEHMDWQQESAKMREAVDMVTRGPDRRKSKTKHQGAERRRQPQGRRDLDNPKQQVW